MMKHTPEPWRIAGGHSWRHGGRRIAAGASILIAEVAPGGFSEEMFANADRIVACVNACAGMDQHTMNRMAAAYKAQIGSDLAAREAEREEQGRLDSLEQMQALSAIGKGVADGPDSDQD